LQGIKALRVKPVEVCSLQEYGKMLKGWKVDAGAKGK
jgi:hypothetical protein